MAYEILHLLKQIEIDGEWAGVGTFTLATDQPGDAIAIRYSNSFAFSGRRRIRMTVPGSTRLKLLQLTLSGTGAMKLFGARVLARPLGQPGAAGWEWHPLPVRVTEEMYAAAALPIRATPEGYDAAALPIRPTSEGYQEAGLPIRPTSEAWSEGALPFPQASLIPQWVSIPVDRI